jgi:hypothetical protein
MKRMLQKFYLTIVSVVGQGWDCLSLNYAWLYNFSCRRKFSLRLVRSGVYPWVAPTNFFSLNLAKTEMPSNGENRRQLVISSSFVKKQQIFYKVYRALCGELFIWSWMYCTFFVDVHFHKKGPSEVSTETGLLICSARNLYMNTIWNWGPPVQGGVYTNGAV